MKKLLPAIKRNSVRIVSCATLLLITGCAMFFPNNEHREASSVMDYLYPKRTTHVDTPTVPELSLPLRVGVAFVPNHVNHPGWNSAVEDERITEKQKMELMKTVSDSFKK